jgi:hypothetical protein
MTDFFGEAKARQSAKEQAVINTQRQHSEQLGRQGEEYKSANRQVFTPLDDQFHKFADNVVANGGVSEVRDRVHGLNGHLQSYQLVLQFSMKAKDFQDAKATYYLVEGSVAHGGLLLAMVATSPTGGKKKDVLAQRSITVDADFSERISNFLIEVAEKVLSDK